MFFTDYIIKYIVNQTNLYQQQCATKHDFTHLEWYVLTLLELKTWIGLLLSIGMLQKIGRLSDYWLKSLCYPPPFLISQCHQGGFTNHEVLAFCK